MKIRLVVKVTPHEADSNFARVVILRSGRVLSSMVCPMSEAKRKAGFQLSEIDWDTFIKGNSRHPMK